MSAEVFVLNMSEILRKAARKCGYVLLSLWLAFHVFAVFIAPATMPPVSPLLQDGYRIAQPYNELLFLNHGYHFFAPDPGASTLISYSVPRTGDAPVTGRFPDVSIRPRLLYHRWFMLAENVWGFDEQTQQGMARAYARHLATRFDSNVISLSRVSHEPSSILRIQAGGRLADPEMFSSEPIGDFNFTTEASSVSSIANNF